MAICFLRGRVANEAIQFFRRLRHYELKIEERLRIDWIVPAAEDGFTWATCLFLLFLSAEGGVHDSCRCNRRSVSHLHRGDVPGSQRERR